MASDDAEAIFLEEAAELLEALEQALLDLRERPGDMDLANAAFRALHTFKGSGAMFGYTRLAAFIHDFETAFDQVRTGAAQVTEALVAVSLEARDLAATLVAEGAGAAPEDGAAEAEGARILAHLRAALGTDAAPAGGEDAAAAPGGTAPGAPDAPGPLRLRFRLAPDSLVNGCDPLLLLDELRELGATDIRADLSGIPTLPALDPDACVTGWEMLLPPGIDEARVRDVFMFVEEGMTLELAPARPAPDAADADAPMDTPARARDGAPAIPAAPAAAPPRRAAAESAPAEVGGGTVRVPAERLDEMMDQMGELVIAQARLNRIAERSSDPALKAVAEEIERLAAGLRDSTMGIRMVPIGSLFGRFRRLVHDLSDTLGKPIALEMSGGETELDKTMIERLADPLVHLIRNAADHGVEAPEARAAAGKPETGTIRLSAEYVGAEVMIRISDDGAGLDPARIRAKAEAAGLIDPGAELPEAALHRMIFEPGFSTAQQVTSLSGRGVGMDVVKRTIEGLRGAIDVDSGPWRGTSVTLRLPLKLAIIDGLLVGVGGERYVIPLAAVEECVALPHEARGGGDGADFLNIRGALAPFLRLRELFSVSAPPDLWQKAVVIRSGDRRVGLAVDQVLGASQTVIKQLSPLHARLRLFSGATILGDGSVALILDMLQLIELGRTLEAPEPPRRSGPAEEAA
ncbi:chemotaxis protein CheA [Rhodovulum sp. DZ06]|uniref:chemotaxis protein CheA n=1 Tax=Rhodovulum sp. DZ06 TaxID=3425126 RepID=UPI003D351F42